MRCTRGGLDGGHWWHSGRHTAEAPCHSHSGRHTIRDTRIRDATIRDTRIRDATIRDARIRDATIRDARIRDARLSRG